MFSIFHRKPTTKEKWLHGIISLLLIIGVSFLVFWFYKTIEWKSLISLGYLGLAVVCFLGSAVVFLPFPVSLFVGISALFLNPLLVALIAGFMVPLTSLISYLIGAEGKVIFEDFSGYKKIHEWMMENTRSFWSTLLISIPPLPIFNFVAVAAGILGVKWYRYFLAALIGKIISYLIIAYLFSFLGAQFIELLPVIKSYL